MSGERCYEHSDKGCFRMYCLECRAESAETKFVAVIERLRDHYDVMAGYTAGDKEAAEQAFESLLSGATAEPDCVAKFLARHRAMQEALKFYAYPCCKPNLDADTDAHRMKLRDDGGKRAREALQEKP